MLGHIKNILKKKEGLLKKKEPLYFDVDEFFKIHYPPLTGLITPFRYANGVLVISATSSVAIQEFFLIKNNLIVFLKDRNHEIRDITTRLR